MRNQMANLAMAVGAVMLASAETAAADQAFRLAVGQEAFVALTENPSTGYRWAIDEKASSNLSILQINDRGFSQDGGGKRLVGAPGIHRWSIQASKSGHASVTFAYRRSWEAASIRTHRVAVEVSAR
ncbi:protease inhibitor I42 family protein [Bradyrhizobium sp. WD16]|uniref:protease inhibitor I42 family protein n=1 Tax=Bradyrhizobium sp. WD16 TaxID=1521768 RepID=UPI0020A2EC60|nr:protease inhibitor I42 family protein [Bradyrhizobium sp. WD16]